MSTGSDALYEISLAIRPGETLEAVTERALTTYVEQLDCDAGAVFEQRGDGENCLSAIPSKSSPAVEAATALLSGDRATNPDAIDTVISDRFPFCEQTDGGTHYWLLELPDFGVLMLARDGNSIPQSTIDSLEPLNEKLANVCQQSREEKHLREERNRYEAVFETSKEPLVNVVFEEDKPIVKRLNDAFVETFGYERSEALGQNLNELIVPDIDEVRHKATELDDLARKGKPVSASVTRQTTDGRGEFRFRAVPVDLTGGKEHFAMYIDITEERARRRRLEQLYSELEGILIADREEVICARAVDSASSIFDTGMGGIHLYDRTKEALVPVATTDRADAIEEFPGEYTDRETVVWEAYESGEALRIDDVERFDGPLPSEDTPVRSALLVPLGDHGILIVSETEANAFDATDFQFAQLLSTHVEIALNRTVRERGLEGIQAVTQATLDSTGHEAIAREVMNRIPDVLDLPLSTIWQYDSGQDALVPLASTPKTTQLVDEQPIFTGEGSLAWGAYQSGETKTTADIGDDSRAYNQESPIRSEIVTPIGDFGVLATGSTHEASFTETDRRLVETLASNVETAMRLVSRRQELELLDQVLARVLRHNLRNDLTIIKGLATTIVDSEDGSTAETAGRIIERCSNLEATADNAREMRQVVRSRDDIVTVGVKTAVEHAIEDLRAVYTEATITASFDATPTITAHPNLTSAIRHLVENAIEHNDGEVVVDVRVFETTETVGIAISDNGPGIPESEIETLTSHGESALEHGSGAGLWIVDRVVEYSDASIEFDTTDGTTATIRFEK